MKKNLFPYFIFTLLLVIILMSPENGFSWSPRTHTFIAGKAGIKNPEYSYFADLFKEENKTLLGPLHYHNAAPDTKVTPAYIDRYPIRIEDYVPVDKKWSKPITIRVPHPAGVLYWKIVELYEAMRGKYGWEYEYYVISMAHYVGDLSNPLHNVVHGDKRASDGRTYPTMGAWAKENHEAFDNILESILPLDGEKDKTFNSRIVILSVTSTDNLKREIAKMANASIALANRCYAEKRLLTIEEALKQTALSVSLLKAIIADTKRTF